jgi:O-methyltransferase
LDWKVVVVMLGISPTTKDLAGMSVTPWKDRLKRIIRVSGYDVVRFRHYPRDLDKADGELFLSVAPYTMTSPEKISALATAVRYVVSNRIPGAIVECGVWKGGSMMAAARCLLELGPEDYELFLFDTFEGMSEPTDKDVMYTGERASDLLTRHKFLHAEASLEEVKRAVLSVGYDETRIHFVKGRVEDTIPHSAPDRISILRLDTDWYESTRHELNHLFPRLSSGGVIIIDDYGFWRGARQATDEYIRENEIPLLLTRLDVQGGRMGVKL